MSTLNQLVKNKKRFQKRRRTKSFLLYGCPQKKGMCIQIRNSVSPKKPNSAKRKVAKIRLRTIKRTIIAAIPGQGHNLQKYSIVLIRGGRTRDIPGVRYKLIKGKYDFSNEERVERTKSRYKYGLKKKKNF